MSERRPENNTLLFSLFDPIQGKGAALAEIQDRPPFSNWDLSPDGTQVAVVHNDDNRVRIVSLATGAECVLELRQWVSFEFVSWSSDGKALFSNGRPVQSPGYHALLRIDLDGRVEVLRQKPNEWHVYPVASPDGRYLAFAVMPFHGNVWMIEDF